MPDINILSDHTSEQKKAWDHFVLHHPLGTFCHLSDYARVIHKVFGYQPTYVQLIKEGELLALWPMSHHKTFFSSQYISMPLFEFGGPLFSHTITEDEIAIFFEGVSKHLKKVNIRVIQSRVALGLTPHHVEPSHKTQFLNEFATLRLGDPDHIYKNVLDRQVRKAVSKARRNNLLVEERHDEESIRDWFYPLYLRYMKERHGAPPLPLDLFIGFAERMGAYLKVFYVKHDKRITAALLGYAVGKRIYISHAPLILEYNSMRPVDLAHWTFIEWACKENFEFFDFGNARYAGQKQFKKKWGCEFTEYNRIYYLRDDNYSPPKPLNPVGYKYQLASQLWRSVIPISWTPVLGQHIHALLGE